MAGPKPIAGFPSRSAAVVHYRGQGRSREWIGARLGIEVKTVAALECSARRSREPHRDFVRPSAGSFPADIRQMLRPHALVREISVDALIRQIVERAAVDDLVDAILDDADVVAEVRR